MCTVTYQTHVPCLWDREASAWCWWRACPADTDRCPGASPQSSFWTYSLNAALSWWKGQCDLSVPVSYFQPANPLGFDHTGPGGQARLLVILMGGRDPSAPGRAKRHWLRRKSWQHLSKTCHKSWHHLSQQWSRPSTACPNICSRPLSPWPGAAPPQTQLLGARSLSGGAASKAVPLNLSLEVSQPFNTNQTSVLDARPQKAFGHYTPRNCTMI